MRRHHSTFGSTPTPPTPGHDHTIPSDLPFLADLKFYAPLANDTCKCDYVSGIAPTTDTLYGTSLSWDSNKSAWLCRGQQDKSGQNRFTAPLNYTGLTLFSGVGSDTILNGATIFMQIKNYSQSGNNYGFVMIMDNAHVSFASVEGQTGNKAGNFPSNGQGCYFAIRAAALNSGYGNYIGDTWTKVAMTIGTAASFGSAHAVKWYTGGRQTGTGNWSNSKAEPTSIGILQVQYNTTWMQAHVKDLRVYGRCLTAAEVAQL